MALAMQALIQHQNSMGVLMERFANNIRVDNASTPNVSTPQTQSELQVKRVNVPDFDGNILEWLRFKELFEVFVHSRANLSDIEKLEYLNSKLSGDALSIVKHLRPASDNYTVAWSLLNKKYDNDENIKSAYMELLFEQPSLKSPNLAQIKTFYNNINEGYQALKKLDDTIEQWSSTLLFNIEKKLDENTATLWCRERKKGETPSFTKFLEFLEDRIFEIDKMQKQYHSNATPKEQQKKSQMRTYATTTQVCPLCSNNHFLYHCDKFIKMSVEQRRNVVKNANICFNCLRCNHMANECNLRTCKKCNKKHNTLLHIHTDSHKANNVQQTAVNIQEASTMFENSSEINHMNVNSSQQKISNRVILPTAIITILDVNNFKYKCRALLDSGSQGTLITESCVQRLGLKRSFDKTIIFGLGSQNGNQSRGKVQLKICANNDAKIIYTEALCLAKLTKIFPEADIQDNKSLSYFSTLNLSDPNFYKEAEIDIIIGADIFMDCCLPETLFHPNGYLAALNTIFGWVVMGRMQSGSKNIIHCNYAKVSLDERLQHFWELEELPSNQQQLSPDEEAAEQHFQKTTKRLECGRYEVRLPFKNNTIDLGESKNIALKRLYAMERKFKQNKHFEQSYKEFMHEYIQLGHMQVVDASCKQFRCFIPHHAVMKPNSTTSKIRVVFDASCKTSNGLSLNDNLLVGPKVQRDLFDILISFRLNKIAFVGDIEKMYRQVAMNKDDRLLQCILWRNNELHDVKEYSLNTVTYGTAAASFLATRTLNQVANDNISLNINTIEAIKKNFYVDDFMFASHNVSEAIKIKNELVTALSQAGFHIRKWSSNSTSFLNTIPLEDRATSLDTEIQQTSTVATLGLIWHTYEDFFKFSCISHIPQENITKRVVLSNIAKIYDPMGWISPVVIHMKIFMQNLWLRGIGWDELLTADLLSEWSKICSNISALPKIKINRWLHHTSDTSIELHGFSDASELAYAAAVYAKVYSTKHEPFVYLIAAKTRVAPVKQVTLPRLELCGAHLLVKLMKKVHASIAINNMIMHAWTDSTIVLAWISNHPRRWKTFIANRTAQIISVLPAQHWHYIRSENNPADLATRGISTDALCENELWWRGPPELHQTTFQQQPFDKIIYQCELEERNKVVVNTASIKECNLINLYSSLTRLIRITALILRFVHNCKNSKQRQIGFITTFELRKAHDIIIKVAQHESYPSEIKLISSNKPLPVNHILSNASPFIDEIGLLRVGGRLNNANISYDQRHPIILNKRHYLTELIIRYHHQTHCHANKRLLLYILQLKYWIPAVSTTLKAVIYKCVVCMRQRSIPYKQQMGQLPKHRVNPAPVFSNVGIDFAGPWQIRSWKGRGAKKYKCWVALFVCLVTKAIHIELVTELSTSAFMASLRRFISRRGKPLNIYTDNGTNFIGANNEIKNLYLFLQCTTTQEIIQRNLAEEQINWHFIPPVSPHFGGLWEAGVKAIKTNLKRVLKEAFPTYEEFSTILCQIECCLNSRPLCCKYEGDTDPLTPAHFIILRPMTMLPEENTDALKENRLSRWQYVQRLVKQFWARWSNEYLHQLHQRNNWKIPQKNVAINDVVIIKEDNAPPSQWLIGRIAEVHPGKDGLVRVATVQTKNGFVKRPIHKLCPLMQDF